jgi:mono/diheme cytochrome c family protein
MVGSRILRLQVGLLCAAALFASIATAAVTPEQRKAISAVIKDVGPVSAHIRKKEFDEAEKALTEAEEKLKAIAKEADVKEDDKAFNPAHTAIAKVRKTLETARNKAEGKKGEAGVSFVKDVVPIIEQHCVECHGPKVASGNLRLDTFAYWKKGGKNGLLVTPGIPANSLMALRMVTPNVDLRMPKGKDKLSDKELETIGKWITQGANFDGSSETATLKELQDQVALASFKYPKPKGNEKVAFTRDIAPWFANLCGGCHSAQRKSGGLSLASYYDLMQGGDSGEVIIPGDKEKSRLFRLVGGLENPRMPRGQGRITKQNYNDLVKWFEEGNTFDGSDPKAPLASFVRSDAELAREKFGKMSDEERKAMREEQIAKQWKRAFPKDAMNRVDGDDIVVVGTVSKERLEEINGWAKEQLAVLKKTFKPEAGPVWKGRLTVFVLKDRFGYDEFSRVIDSREAPKELTGHSNVTLADEEAYVALQDVGDEPTATSPGMRGAVIDHLTGAFLKRGGATPPDWLVRGAGLALAAQAMPGNAYLKALPAQAGNLAATVNQPEEIFANGTFSPATVTSVGLSLVDFLMREGGGSKFVQFANAIQQGQSTAEAAKTAYGVDLPTLARGYLDSLKRTK